MILTGKVVDFAEGFEKIEESLENKLPDQEITEDEQIVLFVITKMFMKDKDFRKAMTIALEIFKDMKLKELGGR